MTLTCGLITATFFYAFLLTGCSAKSIDSEPHRSARWDAYRDAKRERRSTQTVEWQSTQESSTCRLSNIMTFDRWGRRQSGVLATPQGQGRCGSCWAFAATHVFTDYLRLQGHSGQATFSQDYITRCMRFFLGINQGVWNGCCGGNALYAFTYLFQIGAVLETCLPYTLQKYLPSKYNKYRNPLQCPQSCTNPASPFNPNSNRIPGVVSLLNENEVIAALDQGHPVYATIEVRDEFYSYKCGVFCDDPITEANHAVEIVDYSRADSNYQGSPYWVVKNSWGGDWGEGGYFRIARGRNQLSDFVTISGTVMTSPPAPSPSLMASTCYAQVPDHEGDHELIASAAEFVIEQLNSRSEISCAGNEPAFATLSFSKILNGTVQIIEGFAVNVTIEVNIEGCEESRATITSLVTVDISENFLLVEYDYVKAKASAGGSSIFVLLTMLAISVLLLFF